MLASALALTLAAAGPTFVEDDFAKALEQAKTQKKLLFVDAWAPWCHTCVAMREQVFTRPAFKAFEKRVVFAAIDTEKEKSAPFLEKYPVSVWPTLFFIDAQTGEVALRWVGAADEKQMLSLLEAAEKPRGEADAALARNDVDQAARHFRTGDAKPDARATLSMLSALSLARDHEACARTALEDRVTFSAPSDRIAAISWGLSCALELPEGKARSETLPVLVKRATSALTMRDVMPDDISSLFEMLVEEREQAKDHSGKVALALKWLFWLDAQAGKAKTPAERAVFDPHRVNAALAAEQPARMVAPLQQTEKDFPQDYNPPARLALLRQALGEYDTGLADIERALSKCQEGPRKLRLFDIKASLEGKKGDTAARKKTLEAALAWAKKLPRSQVSEKRIAQLQAQVDAAK